MRIIALLVFHLSFFLPALSQQRFHRQMPPGNFSGICHIGQGNYAVVDDKAADDGFYVFHFDIDTIRGRISAARDLGYRSARRPNRDMEAIAFLPAAGTLFIAGEKDNAVDEYTTDGLPTGRRLSLPAGVAARAKGNRGLESLTYSASRHLFYTTTEQPLRGDTVHRVWTFDDSLAYAGEHLYKADAPISRKYTTGVSELCALDDGRLLVMERQIRIPRLKIGACCVVRIYETRPGSSMLLEKRLLTELKTRLTLTSRRFANYEGLCPLPGGWLLLIADSQRRYRHVLRDWLLIVKPPQ